MNEIQEPLVSICCMTYNHEKYIRDAIESFLMQETDFKFEVLIHDDASTDRTADIIRSYEKKYPEIIKPIYQTENQYSKGVIISSTFNFPRAKGKYIAFCEGDDYWTDPKKLQKQINEMSKYPEYNLSFHPAVIKWVDGSRKDKLMSAYSKETKVFETKEVILMGGGGMPTNSLVFKKEVIPEIIAFFNLVKEAPFGDHYIQILGSIDNGALFIPDVMGVYRQGVEGSWCNGRRNSNKDAYLKVSMNKITANKKMDVFTNHNYSDNFSAMNRRESINLLLYNNMDVKAKKEVFQCNKNYLTIKDKILFHTLYSNCLFTKILNSLSNSPTLIHIYRSLKDKYLPDPKT